MKDKNLQGSNRSVEIVLNKEASFENYYWLEGPLPGDQGRRITVTHPGQPMQCSNCFCWDHIKYTAALGPVCPANGNGKACKEMGTPRAKMGSYMKALEKDSGVGYSSMKQKFLAGSGSQLNMDERLLGEDGEEVEQVEETLTTILPPMVEKDRRIQELEKENQKIASLKEELTKVKAMAKTEAGTQSMLKKKVEKAKKMAEMQVAEAIKFDTKSIISENADTGRPDGRIIMLAEYQDIDEFDEDENELKPKNKNDFMKEVVKDIEEHSKVEGSTDAEHMKEVIEHVKLQVLKVMKETGKMRTMRNRRLSTSSKRSSEEISLPRSQKQKLQPKPSPLAAVNTAP